MKSRSQRGSFRSPPSFYTYLKPGALAKLRYNKITARSKQMGMQALRALIELESSSDSASPQPQSTGLAIEGIPCFGKRVSGFPRCLQRKKLVAATPVFTET